MLELIIQYGVLAGSVTAIIGAIFALRRLYEVIRQRILVPIWDRFDKIDKVSSTLGPNGGTSLYDKVVGIDKKISITDARTQSLHSALGLAEWFSDIHGQTVAVNDMASRITGRPESDFLDNNWINVLHPDDRDAVVEEWLETVKDRRTFSMKYRWLDSHDKSLWIRATAKPVFDSQKKFIGYIGTVVLINKEE